MDTTVRRALALGNSIDLVADAHTTENSRHFSAAQIIQHHNDALANIDSFGPRVRAVPAGALRLE